MLPHPRKIGRRFSTASKCPSQSPVQSVAIKVSIQLTLSMKPFQYLRMLDLSEACIVKLWKSYISFSFLRLEFKYVVAVKGSFSINDEERLRNALRSMVYYSPL